MNDEFEKREGSPFREFVSFGALLHDMEQQSQTPLPAGYVPMSFYWLTDSTRRILGEIRLRHSLNEALEEEGGHIGYTIRPSERGKGYGTAILGLGLKVAQGLGLNRVFVTCDTDNEPSARVIRRHGGILTSEGISKHSGKPISRYWIEIN